MFHNYLDNPYNNQYIKKEDTFDVEKSLIEDSLPLPYSNTIFDLYSDKISIEDFKKKSNNIWS